jgi:hypothetical protein
VSLGIENREEDIDTFLAVLGSIIRQRHASGQSPYKSRAVIKQQINDFVRASAKKVYS